MKIGSRHLKKRALQGLKKEISGQFQLADLGSATADHGRLLLFKRFYGGKIQRYTFSLPRTFRKRQKKVSVFCHLGEKQVCPNTITRNKREQNGHEGAKTLYSRKYFKIPGSVPNYPSLVKENLIFGKFS